MHRNRSDRFPKQDDLEELVHELYELGKMPGDLRPVVVHRTEDTKHPFGPMYTIALVTPSTTCGFFAFKYSIQEIHEALRKLYHRRGWQYMASRHVIRVDDPEYDLVFSECFGFLTRAEYDKLKE